MGLRSKNRSRLSQKDCERMLLKGSPISDRRSYRKVKRVSKLAELEYISTETYRNEVESVHKIDSNSFKTDIKTFKDSKEATQTVNIECTKKTKMILNELEGNLFNICESYTKLIMISKDVVSECPISSVFFKKYPYMAKSIKHQIDLCGINYPTVFDYKMDSRNPLILSMLIKECKDSSTDKELLEGAIEHLRGYIYHEGISKIVIPKTGRKGLDYEEFKNLLYKHLSDLDVEILILRRIV